MCIRIIIYIHHYWTDGQQVNNAVEISNAKDNCESIKVARNKSKRKSSKYLSSSIAKFLAAHRSVQPQWYRSQQRSPSLNNYIKCAGPRRKVKIRATEEETGPRGRRRRQKWKRVLDEGDEKVADIKRKQSRCDLTCTPAVPPRPARPALRIALWKRVMAMAGICKSVIAAVFVRRI